MARTTVLMTAGSVLLLQSGCSEDNLVTSTQPLNLGAMPEVPRPENPFTPAMSGTLRTLEPIRTIFAPSVVDAFADWTVNTRDCRDALAQKSCEDWTAATYPDAWLQSIPSPGVERPTPTIDVALCDQAGQVIRPRFFRSLEDRLLLHGCEAGECWIEARWEAQLREIERPPMLTQERFWMPVGYRYILSELYDGSITNSVPYGVDREEGERWAESVSVGGERRDKLGILRTAIRASYPRAATDVLYEEELVETTFTPPPTPRGQVAVYQLWILVDQYRLTDENGDTFQDPSYRFDNLDPVRVKGVSEAHVLTYFPSPFLD